MAMQLDLFGGEPSGAIDGACSFCEESFLAGIGIFGLDVFTDEAAGDRFVRWWPCCDGMQTIVAEEGFEAGYGLTIEAALREICPELDVLEVTEPGDSAVVCRLVERSPARATGERDRAGGPCVENPSGWREEIFTDVDAHHRHLDAPKSWKFGVAVYNGDLKVGVAVVGRPVSRRLQEAQPLTWEVTRVTTFGHPALRRNAASKLYAAVAEKARALGATKLITYTMEDESGHSLLASGWKATRQSSAEGHDRPSRRRSTKAPTCSKTRWERGLTKKTRREVELAAADFSGKVAA